MVKRLLSTFVVASALLVLVPGAAYACGGLVAPGHAEVLRKATTLAAWHDGYEHYVTGFEFAGSASKFGYIIPLPANPTKIQKGGAWTLERLEREVNPPSFGRVLLAAEATSAKSSVQVLQRTTIEALDIAIVRGGGRAVYDWARENGFAMTPDTPKILGEYASNGAVFALARFDNERAVKRGLIEGQGTVIHFTIPTRAPWIPLKILTLGKIPQETVDADFFVLTDEPPALSPLPADMAGMRVKKFEAATPALLTDLRSDKGMSWLPNHGMWLTAMTLHTTASRITTDLSIDGGHPGRATSSEANGAVAVAWPFWLAIVTLAAIVVATARNGRGKVRTA